MPTETDFDLIGFSAAMATQVATAARRVVRVAGGGPWSVSGVVWDRGLVVTAHEGLSGDDEFVVTPPEGDTRRAVLLGRDPSTDVALLRVETGEAGEWPVAPVPPVGALALAVGRGETGPLAASGHVAEAGPAWRSLRGGLIDARLVLDLRFGNRLEGGAVIAADGRLIGLAVSGPGRTALAIPASTVSRAVRALQSRGYVARGYLGASLHPLAGAAGGVILVGVEADSPAARAGLVVGDIITTWDGEAIGSIGAVSARLGTDAVGKTVKLGVGRGGSAIELDVTIGERPRA